MKKASHIALMVIAVWALASSLANTSSVHSQQITPNVPLDRNRETSSRPSITSDQMAISVAAVPRKILIFGPSINSGAPSEASIATAQGHMVTVVNAATWSSFTTADFKQFDAIVFGDPICSDNTNVLAAAEANKAVWSPAITGAQIIIGTDPIFHIIRDNFIGAQKLIANGINLAASGPGTGLYMSLSCFYATAPPGTPVSVLSAIGDFRVHGQESTCFESVTIVQPDHPAMAGITSAELSNWSCSVHAFVTSFPANFSALAVSNSSPYIIATGGTLFNTCIQDESNGGILRINSATGDYLYTNCAGLTISGTGALTIKGSITTLQHYAVDRRVIARVDAGVSKATASIQVFPAGTTFTITDKNIGNNTCSCL